MNSSDFRASVCTPELWKERYIKLQLFFLLHCIVQLYLVSIDKWSHAIIILLLGTQPRLVAVRLYACKLLNNIFIKVLRNSNTLIKCVRFTKHINNNFIFAFSDI